MSRSIAISFALPVAAGFAIVLSGCDDPEKIPPPAPSAAPSATATSHPSWDPGQGEPVRVAIRASKDGFEPKLVKVVQGRPAFLEFTRTDGTSCVNAVKMPWSSNTIQLPENETVSVQIPDTSQAGDFVYGCWMDMLYGRVDIVASE